MKLGEYATMIRHTSRVKLDDKVYLQHTLSSPFYKINSKNTIQKYKVININISDFIKN